MYSYHGSESILPSRLVSVVSDIPEVSDFINDKSRTVFINQGGTLLWSTTPPLSRDVTGSRNWSRLISLDQMVPNGLDGYVVLVVYEDFST